MTNLDPIRLDLEHLEKGFPSQSNERIDIVEFTDYITLQSLLHAPCTIMAEKKIYHSSHEDEIKWFLRDDRTNEEKILTTCSARIFRSIMSRFNFHYLKDDLYHGFAMRSFLYKEKTFRCSFYVGNASYTGFWIRIVSRLQEGMEEMFANLNY